MIPFVIDNDQRRLSDVLNRLLDESRERPLDIATAYFPISGDRIVKDGLHRVGAFRLLPGATGKKAGKRGRRPDTDAKADAKVAQAMVSGQYPAYRDLANEMGMTEGDVCRAVDRHRQRQKRHVK